MTKALIDRHISYIKARSVMEKRLAWNGLALIHNLIFRNLSLVTNFGAQTNHNFVEIHFVDVAEVMVA